MFRCFLDLDGCLADFVGAALLKHMAKWPYDHYRGDKGWDLPSILGMSVKEFYSGMDYEFWVDLQRTHEADDIYQSCIRWFGHKNVFFLTSASGNYGCLEGKRLWVREHYSTTPLITMSAEDGDPRKWALASSHSILIDDCSKNVDEFIDHGGFAFLVPRPWNRDWQHENELVERLNTFLESFADADIP